MNYYAATVAKLIDELSKLPGIGRKSAQRLAFYILGASRESVKELTTAIDNAKNSVKFCSECCNLTDDDPCLICSDERRDHTTICVMESASDVIALEKTGEYNGLYHVLHGALSPVDNISPEDIKIKELLLRVTKEDIKEVVLATDPDVEGEATAMYIAKLLKPFDVKVTRIAKGIPVGLDIEYIDGATLLKAFEGRLEINE